MSVRWPMLIINQTLPLVVQLVPNPNNIEISSSKVYSQTQTLGGWVFEHWGDKPQVMKVRGRTQGLAGDYSNELSVEMALFKLEQLYRMDKVDMISGLAAMADVGATMFGGANTLSQLFSSTGSGGLEASALRTLSTTYIYFKMDVYFGFFTSFSWHQDAERSPRNYEYEFEFLATNTAQNKLANVMFLPTTVGGAAIRAAATTAASVPAAFAAMGSISNIITNPPGASGILSQL